MRVQNGHQEEMQWKHLKPGHCGGVSPSHSTDSFPLQNKGKTAMKSPSRYYGLTLLHGFRDFYGQKWPPLCFFRT